MMVVLYKREGHIVPEPSIYSRVLQVRLDKKWSVVSEELVCEDNVRVSTDNKPVTHFQVI